MPSKIGHGKTAFVWQALSQKQKKVLTWWTPTSPYADYDGVIADGAVRSGKTVSMAAGFVLWAMHTFNGVDFALCGKTVGSLRRNVVNVLRAQLESLGYEYDERRTENLMTITAPATGTTNFFYFFGGKDESSQDLIQGMTLGGVLFDEVALMPQSFVSQAEARCSLDGSRLWYNCNPRGPSHYFKQEYVDKAAERRLMYLHFTMDDNLTLSEQVRERYRRMFTGVFYQRNILGLWVAAEGRIYTAFSDDNIIKTTEWQAKDAAGRWTHPLRQQIMLVTAGVDFGGSKSSHAFVVTAFTRGFQHIITVKEKRIKDEIDPTELDAAFVEFIKAARAEYPQLAEVYCDSAEQVLIRGFAAAARLAHLPIAVKNARKGEIIDRIRFYSAMQDQRRHFVVQSCPETIRAIQEAVWDDKHEDVRLDDGSTNIDSLDAMEYSAEPFMAAMTDLRRA